ncbi:MAG: hypothetical protein HZB55_07345 [Deltaproteobacteria bacterium]|nr:hypothetical protein [Deltaproteobacteria bacterium]
MADPFLRPEDVSPEAARRVLAALNAAASPEALAATIELVGEPDIGVRLAARLLARRAELGGFTTVAQIADVPLIGPERFDDLVRALAGDALGTGTGTGGEDAELRAEVARLRGLVEGLAGALGSRDRLTLRVVAERPYFGQRVTVAARLTDGLGREPRIDAPVTFVAAWGRLRTEGGVRAQAGETVTARTGADGTARVTLLPPAAEDLDPAQELALEAALADLDPGAPDPAAAAAALRELARQYRWDAGIRFREAVDVYAREFRSALLDTVNQWDVWSAWPLVRATVLAFSVGDGAEESEVRTTAALTLPQRNWLPAFVDACQEVAREQSTLTADLRDAKGLVADPARFLGEVHGRVQEYLEGQRGFLGEYVGRRLAERELSRFAAEDLEDLPVAVRMDLFPALHTAAGAVAVAGGRMVAALGQTRLDLGKDIDRKIDQIDVGTIAVLGERVGVLEGKVAGKVDQGAFSSFQVDVNTRLEATVDQASFVTLRDSVNQRLDRKADVTAVSTLRADLTGTLAQKADAAAVSAEIATLRDRTFTLDQKLNTLDTSVTRIDGDVAGLLRVRSPRGPQEPG